MQCRRPFIEFLNAGLACIAVMVSTLITATASAQVADFQIVWINVGEVAAASDGRAARAGRQLFMAPDLVEFSLKKITVARIDVEPAVIALEAGQRFCLTSLQVRANTEERAQIDNAPLAVSVRQDQRERLALERGKKNLCFAPTVPGEYPIRFNSLLPARDGTTRGAQIFLRVNAEGESALPSATGRAHQLSHQSVSWAQALL